jgi:RNA polymerase sigma factor (TIGR02999 family)
MEITVELPPVAPGDQAAMKNAMIAELYQDLRGVARRSLGRNRANVTLNTTALVNETCLRLLRSASATAQNRSHFLNLAAKMMRQLICDFARRHLRELKHVERDTVSEEERNAIAADERDTLRLAAVDVALEAFEAINPRGVRVVECRYFLGLSTAETAETLGLSVRTVEREWTAARAWLAGQLAAHQGSI